MLGVEVGGEVVNARVPYMGIEVQYSSRRVECLAKTVRSKILGPQQEETLSTNLKGNGFP